MKTQLKVTTYAALTAALATQAAAQYSITVLHNNDGESAFFSDSNNGIEYGGLAEFKTMFDTTKSFYEGEGHGVVSVYAGDTFLAGPNFQASLDSGVAGSRTFYDALAISRIGYDASIIGNHEFDFGPDVLAEFIGDAQTTNPTKYLSANLDFSGNAALNSLVDTNIFKSTTVTVSTAVGNKTVGIIGATTENLPFITSPGAVSVSDVVTAVNAEAVNLVNAGVDHIILGSHLQGITEDQAIVSSLNSNIDLIVAGGGDELNANPSAAAPSTVHSGAPASVATTGFHPDDVEDGAEGAYPDQSTAIPIVTTKDNYNYLGRVTLNFDENGDLTSVDNTSNPQLNTGYAADAQLAADIAPVKTYTDGLASTVIGTSSVQLLQGGSDTIRSQETNLGNLVADAFLKAAQDTDVADENITLTADRTVALVGGGGIRSSVDATDDNGNAISQLDTFSVSPFGNFVAVVENVTVADLKLMLENAYSRTVDTDLSDGVNPVRSGGGTGRYAQIAGFSVVYDVTAQALVLDDNGSISVDGERVLTVTLDDGTVLVEDGVIVADNADLEIDVVMSSFHARGGDQYLADYQSEDYTFATTTTTDQQAVQALIASFNGDDLANNGYGAINGEGRISAVPEPSAYAAIAGLIALALVVRRRRS
ncbi:MAG: bifunctional metallophosphatase/5'-nucleotidase [Lentimonas sp.]